MPSFRSLLLLHGYAFTFWYIFASQAGIPIPADPVLLLMGAFAGDGVYSLRISFLLALTASILGDVLWYELGRQKGRAILNLLCKLSIEPDSCLRRTESGFRKRGAWTLIFAKFVPGMSLVSVPLAGTIRMPRGLFLLADAAGCTLWVGAYLMLGFLFHKQVSKIIVGIGLIGRQAGIVALTLISIYIAAKYFQRWRFHHQLRINRVTPEAALSLLKNGALVTIVDLRSPIEIKEGGLKIAGAVVLQPEDLDARSHQIPDDHEVILYCSCPNEVTSARIALRLKRAGITKVRPLEGGFEAWHERNLPVEPYYAPAVLAS